MKSTAKESLTKARQLIVDGVRKSYAARNEAPLIKVLDFLITATTPKNFLLCDFQMLWSAVFDGVTIDDPEQIYEIFYPIYNTMQIYGFFINAQSHRQVLHTESLMFGCTVESLTPQQIDFLFRVRKKNNIDIDVQFIGVMISCKKNTPLQLAPVYQLFPEFVNFKYEPFKGNLLHLYIANENNYVLKKVCELYLERSPELLTEALLHVDVNGNTPLHLAVHVWNENTALYLLDLSRQILGDQFADLLKQRNKRGFQILHTAVQLRLPKLVAALVKAGADTNATVQTVLAKKNKKRKQTTEECNVLTLLDTDPHVVKELLNKYCVTWTRNSGFSANNCGICEVIDGELVFSGEPITFVDENSKSSRSIPATAQGLAALEASVRGVTQLADTVTLMKLYIKDKTIEQVWRDPIAIKQIKETFSNSAEITFSRATGIFAIPTADSDDIQRAIAHINELLGKQFTAKKPKWQAVGNGLKLSNLCLTNESDQSWYARRLGRHGIKVSVLTNETANNGAKKFILVIHDIKQIISSIREQQAASVLTM